MDSLDRLRNQVMGLSSRRTIEPKFTWANEDRSVAFNDEIKRACNAAYASGLFTDFQVAMNDRALYFV